jgi:Restriction endonuclease
MDWQDFEHLIREIFEKEFSSNVGVAAVRDLYGTVVNEGATKGILVTTTDYGLDPRPSVRHICKAPQANPHPKLCKRAKISTAWH